LNIHPLTLARSDPPAQYLFDGSAQMGYLSPPRSLHHFAPVAGGCVSIVQPLLVLQAIDTRIRALQQEAQDIPLRKEQEKKRLVGAQNAMTEAQAALKNAQARVDEVELEVKARREAINKLRGQQVNLKTNKEFAAMNLEIATIEGQIDTLESRQVAAMDAVVPARARVGDCEKRLQEDKGVVDGYLAELDGRLAAVQADRKQADAERMDALKAVPPAFIGVYARLLDRRWPPVVGLEGNACGGCHLTQPPSVSHVVRRNNSLVVCQMCGRILYNP
jgi:predicted  nucleic acid-binding Zn-ribbon protein